MQQSHFKGLSVAKSGDGGFMMNKLSVQSRTKLKRRTSKKLRYAVKKEIKDQE